LHKDIKKTLITKSTGEMDANLIAAYHYFEALGILALHLNHIYRVWFLLRLEVDSFICIKTKVTTCYFS